MKRMLILMLGVSVVCANVASAATIYVSTNSPSDGPGTAWTNAFWTIQSAVNMATNGDTVLVSNGVYDAGGAVTPGFALTNRVCITNAITLESVAGPSNTVIVGAADPVSTNGPAAVRCVYMTNSAVLNGFTLTNGHTLASGGLAVEGGGGVYLGGVMSNCTVTGCSAEFGGGIFAGEGSRIAHCRIAGNQSMNDGGGVFGGGFSMVRCTVVGNLSKEDGGGVRTYYLGSGSAPSFSNCLFAENTCVGSGGGLIIDHVPCDIVNCTITRNAASGGGGIALQAVPPPNYRMENCIIFDQMSGGDVAWPDSTSPSNCCIGSTSGFASVSACITNNPRFIDPTNGNYRLSVTSLCINAGTNAPGMTGETDLAGNDRIYANIVDIGCYESSGMWLAITNPVEGQTVPHDFGNVQGGNNPNVVGALSWTNVSTGGAGTHPGAWNWGIPIPLQVGTNIVTVSGTNTEGQVTNVTVTFTRADIGTGTPIVTITNKPGSVAYDVTSFVARGTNNMQVFGTMWVSNAANGESYSFAVATNWTAPAVTLVEGANEVSVSATNLLAQTAIDTATVVRRAKQGGDSDVTYYTAPGGLHISPFVTWANAATQIQAAVDVTSDGDMVLVSNGVYNTGGRADVTVAPTSRVCIDRSVIVQSVNGAEVTYIVGAADPATLGPGSNAVRGAFITSNAVLAGFTVTNGYSDTSGFGQYGGGVFLDDAGSISNCVLTGNRAASWGGGVFCDQRSLATHCLIRGNRGGKGGGIAVYATGKARNCLIVDNTADDIGGGLYLDVEAVAESCTIRGNSAPRGADGAPEVGSCTLLNTIIYDPDSDSNWYGNVSASNCCSRAPSIAADPGCITNAPSFINPSAGNYRLGFGSPCVNAGTEQPWMTNAVDLDGAARIRHDTIDMGAYEYDATTYDSDADTVVDWNEYIADTNPTNPASYFHITAISNLPPVTLYFDSSSYRLYTMAGCSNLLDGVWTDVPGAGPRAGIGEKDSIADTNEPPYGPFYRIHVEIP